MTNNNQAINFTLKYIEAVQQRLQINVNEKREPVFVPERIEIADLRKLGQDLNDIWSMRDEAIASVQNCEGAFLQSVAYGLIDDFDLTLKVGYLIGDRVVLWDYLLGRLLREKNIAKVNLPQIGVIGNNLVSASLLAEKGYLVILPHPFEWHKRAKQCFAEAAKKHFITPEILGLVCSLSVARELKLQPYTILESEVNWKKALERQKQCFKSISNIDGSDLFKTLLTAMLSERLLTDVQFEEAFNKPTHEFHDVVAKRKDFYSAFKQALTFQGSFQSDQQLTNLSEQIENTILSWNSKVRSFSKDWNLLGATITGTLSLLAASGVATTPLGIASAVAGLSTTLSNYLTRKDTGENVITAVFMNLLKRN